MYQVDLYKVINIRKYKIKRITDAESNKTIPVYFVKKKRISNYLTSMPSLEVTKMLHGFLGYMQSL